MSGGETACFVRTSLPAAPLSWLLRNRGRRKQDAGPIPSPLLHDLDAQRLESSRRDMSAVPISHGLGGSGLREGAPPPRDKTLPPSVPLLPILLI